jgi:hypothetical protein
MPISVVCFARKAQLGGTRPTARSVRSTPRLIFSALNSPTTPAMSGVMCSMVPARSSIGLNVPVVDPDLAVQRLLASISWAPRPSTTYMRDTGRKE